ncbi:CMGC family protein kinase [Histomonas meleagridis]|uniref:CMGC family protein kinase n=1 Tax=Histomonas meleagridis TaxID=135588 RepID=UPI00355A8EFC|nr:CMGC family protein kinase [Histomonas meleagridis]KAH0804505.1 CMGC family protein kinase [Histomonas meleagridis]
MDSQTPDPGGGTIEAHYDLIQELGSGCYSTVYKARDKISGEIVALKKVKIFDKMQGLPMAYYRESKFLMNNSHENIISLKKIFNCHENHQIYLVLECCECDLNSLIKEGHGLNYKNVKQYMLQILNALGYMHSKNIAHRDIKPSNVLIDSEGKIKLADFGLARNLDHTIKPLTYNVVTMSYRAPELLMHDNHYTTSIDIWSLGCLLYTLITGKILFNSTSSNEVSRLMSIFNICGSPNNDNWPEFANYPNSNIFMSSLCNCEPILHEYLEDNLPKQFYCIIDLIEKMLSLDPSKRPTVAEILSHPFFTDETPFDINSSDSFMQQLSKISYLECNSYKLNHSPKLLRPQRIVPPPMITVGFAPYNM